VDAFGKVISALYGRPEMPAAHGSVRPKSLKINSFASGSGISYAAIVGPM
jgi:hypothetical protein